MCIHLYNAMINVLITMVFSKKNVRPTLRTYSILFIDIIQIYIRLKVHIPFYHQSKRHEKNRFFPRQPSYRMYHGNVVWYRVFFGVIRVYAQRRRGFTR